MSLMMWRWTQHYASGGGLSAYAVGADDPEFVADFAGVLNSGTEYYRSGGSDTTFSSVFTFSRPTTATYVNSSGVLTTASSGVARRGHHVWNGSSWENAGILIETAAATNLFTYSGTPSDAAWTKQRISVGSLTAGGPAGGYYPLTVSASSTSPSQLYQIGKSITTSTPYTSWAIVKYSSGNGWFAINVYDTTAGNVRAWFDVNNGVIGTKDAGMAGHGMFEVSDGWFFCWAYRTVSAASGGVSFEILAGDGLTSCASGDAMLFAAAQFEVGSVPTSYIPTAGTTVTRAAETLTVAGATFDAQSTGTISALANFAHPSIDTNAQLWQLNGTGPDIALGIYAANNIQLNMDGTTAGTAVTAGNRHVSARWNGPLGTLAVSLDGGTIATNTTAAFSIAAHDFRLGVASVGQYKSYAMIRHWPGIALSDSDMQTAST